MTTDKMWAPWEIGTRNEFQTSRPSAREVRWLLQKKSIKEAPQGRAHVLPISCLLSCPSPKPSSPPFHSSPKDFSTAYPKSSSVPGSLANSVPDASQQNNGWMIPYWITRQLARLWFSLGHTLGLSGQVVLDAFCVAQTDLQV